MTEEAEDVLLPKIDEEIPSPNKKEIFIIKESLGSGAYGAVYEVQRKSDGKTFAMKCERVSIKRPVLQMDLTVMLAAMKQRSKHFARAVEKGKMPGRFNFIVMKMLGESLWSLRVCRNTQRYTLNTSLKLAEQCLVAIENLHRAGFLHRDIKPGNFAVGRTGDADHHTVFMLDFGLSRPFANEDKAVRAPRDQAPFRGTTRYASIAAHKLMEQSRKDDLESLMYMVLEWTSGKLPWAEFTSNDRDKVLQKKQDARTVESVKAVLYEHCPRKNFEKILDYLHGLQYIDVPDYKFIHFIITSVYKQSRISLTQPLDYDPLVQYHGPVEIPGDGTPRREDHMQEADMEGPLADKESEQISISVKGPQKKSRKSRGRVQRKATVSVMSAIGKTP